MGRIILWIGVLAAALMPLTAKAEPADIDSAARGVVRVVIIELDGDRLYYAGHGTGFAVGPKTIVTNAHVVRRLLNNRRLGIGIIPSEGDDPSVGRLVDYDAKRDLALIEITGDLRLPPLTLTSNAGSDDAEIVAIGYPGVVDTAQGLVGRDMVRSMAPVKSRGFLSGERSTPGFNALLHTVSIAGGNSGGPLVDNCGRVLGVNTSGTLSNRGEAEFFFAIAIDEVTSFLRRNDVKPVLADMPCRSLAEIEQEEREREEAEKERAEEEAEAIEQERTIRETALRDTIESDVQEERENAMAFAAVLLLVAAGGAAMAAQARQKEDGKNRAIAFGAVAGAAALGAIYLWVSRPGGEDVDDRFSDESTRSSASVEGSMEGGTEDAGPLSSGSLICTLDADRSRATGRPAQSIPFTWTDEGCVNGKTQYGVSAGEWTRVLVPNEEDVVSVNTLDPQARTYTVERYLISRNAMEKARDVRQSYTPPSCSADGAATSLGDKQGGVLALLPESPNERLVYNCRSK